ncbi:hypothetical protein N7451_012733 [Penicillium sp. IBT 35674x]|nr:hypothetical protein N7451_012733 [Penicillium sp. IBT 35674x]
MERSEPPTIPPDPPCSVQRVKVASKSLSLIGVIHKTHCPEMEKEDPVDWDSWLTPEALSGEAPPPFG